MSRGSFFAGAFRPPLAWTAGPLVAFDTETTGVDVERDRIVTAYLGDGSSSELSWLVDPGIRIPVEATRVNHITTEHARANGRPARESVEEIAGAIAKALSVGGAVVVYKADFDFTILDRECRRHGLSTLERRLGRLVGPLVDPLVLDRHFDRYRRGSRTLASACDVYEVALPAAHDSRNDALATLGVARALAAAYPEAGNVTATALHELQVGAQRDWAANFTAYRRVRGDADPEIDGSWPVKPYPKNGSPGTV
ncbi:MAG: exonuclease domain-containing protein [Candidatus Dormibacteria bacterium]